MLVEPDPMAGDVCSSAAGDKDDAGTATHTAGSAWPRPSSRSEASPERVLLSSLAERVFGGKLLLSTGSPLLLSGASAALAAALVFDSMCGGDELEISRVVS